MTVKVDGKPDPKKIKRAKLNKDAMALRAKHADKKKTHKYTRAELDEMTIMLARLYELID